MEYFATLGRVMLGAFFLLGGIGKFIVDPNLALLKLEQTGLIYADKIVWVVAAIELAGGVALLTGFATRLAAFLLGASAVFMAVMLNPFWLAPEIIGTPAYDAFVKSMMPVAGLLVILGFGPGPLSIDANE